MRRFIIILGFSLIWASNLSYAQSFSEAQTALHSGEYTQASLIGKTLGTADGFALAAESINAQVLLCQTEKPKRSAKQARKLAEAALDIDPHHPNALLQYALAQGFVTRRSSPMSVWRKKLPRKLLQNIETYEAVAPDDPRIEAFIGAWHFGIVRRAGKKRAKDWYNASAEDGIMAYERALSQNSNDIIISSNYAFSILEHDPEKYASKVIKILIHIKSTEAKTALERDLQALTHETLRLLTHEVPNYAAAVESATYFLEGGS